MKRSFAIFVGAAALSLGLTAFVFAGGQNEGSSTATASNQSVTLSWWDYDSRTDAPEQDLINAFEKVNSKIIVNRTYVPYIDFRNKIVVTSAVNNALPDLAPVDNNDVITYALSGIVADITDLVNTWGQADQYFAGPWKAVSYKGHVYGIPRNTNNLAIFYNKDMFDAAGLKYPPSDGSWSWDDLHADAQKLTKPGVYGFNLAGIKSEEGNFEFMPFMWETGSDIWNLNSPGTVKALQFLGGLIKDGYMSPEVVTMNQDNSASEFTSGRAAMMQNGTWNVPVVQKNAKFNWAVAALPGNPDHATELGGEVYIISSQSKHREAAFEVIKWAVAPEQQLQPWILAMGTIPPRKDVAALSYYQNDPVLKVFASQVGYARPRGVYGPDYAKMSDAMQVMFQEVYTGQKSAQDAVDEAWTKVKPLVDKMKANQ